MKLFPTKDLEKAFIFLLIFSFVSCNYEDPKCIKLYIANDAELKAETFSKYSPELVLKKDSFKNIRLIQNSEKQFTIELELTSENMEKIAKIISSNVGKRLIFIMDNRMLFAPVISGPLTQKRLVIELISTKREYAESIAKAFEKPFEFYDNRYYKNIANKQLGKAYQLRDEGKIDEAIKIFKEVAKTIDSNKRIFLYNEIAICHILKGKILSASQIYKRLVDEAHEITIENYKIISQAYLFLYLFEKNQKNFDLAEAYFEKGVGTLDYIIKTFPLTTSASEANLALGEYALMRGNISEAQKRASIAKIGELKCRGFLLSGLCYEWQKDFEKAVEEYEGLLKLSSCIEEKRIALEFINNLKKNKSNVEEFLLAFENLISSGK